MEIKIGLEIHIQLTELNTKLFCGCNADYRDEPPNTYLCPVCLGLPGSLPSVNKRAIEFAIMLALGLDSEIPSRSLFYRKNYFYPDMPKNFQITQYNKAGGVPIGIGGQIPLELDNYERLVNLTRLQIEEDPARISYEGSIISAAESYIDYNRAGITLIEIVTEPDLKTPMEARVFLQKLRSIVEHLGIADLSLEGSMRCDANISLFGGKRVEIKNISSYKDVQKALKSEVIRQKNIYKHDGVIIQETRHWDNEKKRTFTLRTKEEEEDYRYFPEPDLPPIEISDAWINKIKRRMPELPDERIERFVNEYKLPQYDAEVLIISSKALADFYEQIVSEFGSPKYVSNWIMSDLMRHLNKLNIEIDESKITSSDFVEMLQMIEDGTISGKLAKRILHLMMETGKSPSQIAEKEGLLRIKDKKVILDYIEKVFSTNKKAIEDTKTDPKAIHYLIGQVMKLSRGRCDPGILNKLIRKELKKID
ncbi:MAG: Asp-tRNA(Asn)/Glu-tRNA(Gln) amidotransferase subunit GatB [Candidatus Lokiarchaeota archaeon]|nr:Asp-tRNA(Asn)/Glu-tRNA(Gln) amidotransferase subunit GatB [Candidatus Lokiarchaeota archaeon]